jgi:hypothetical protein
MDNENAILVERWTTSFTTSSSSASAVLRICSSNTAVVALSLPHAAVTDKKGRMKRCRARKMLMLLCVHSLRQATRTQYHPVTRMQRKQVWM